MSENHNIFNGLTVVELASVLAGPLVGSFFSELGAMVIKIESLSKGGDVTRSWIHPLENTNRSGPSDYYTAANAKKIIVSLDLDTTEGQDELRKYVSTSDIVISNFLPKVAQKLSCTFDHIKTMNESIIMVQLSSYGRYDNRPGFDLLMQAACGYIGMSGSHEAKAKMPTAMIDILAAHQMKEAVLIALYKKATGYKGGQEIYVSLFNAGLTGLINQASSYLNSGIIAQPMGTLHPTIAPYGDIFYSEDGVAFMLAVGTDLQFERLGKTLIINDKEMVYFCTNLVRVRERDRLVQMLKSKFEYLSWLSISQILTKESIPFSHIAMIDETCDSPQSQSMIRMNEEGYRRISDIAFEIINHE
jgi:crotonobetainyl-CoA:carnitine CoA-transferase CaiB-like acyl-CoA transferase